MRHDSEILKNSVSIIFPLIIITGIYVIVNGGDSSGGGFQGGAVLSALFVIKYYVSPYSRSDVREIGKAEKYVLFLLFVVLISFMYYGFNLRYPELNPYYILVSNVLIASKVFLTLGVIFYRFLYFDN